MEFFSNHWLWWMCGFAPAMLYLGIGRLRVWLWEHDGDKDGWPEPGPKPVMPAHEIAMVVAWISGFPLVMAAIHVLVYAVIP